MDKKEIFIKLSEVTLATIKNVVDWEKAILYIERFEKVVGFKSSYIDKSGEEVKVDTEAGYFASKVVHRLYHITTTEFPVHTNWNRAKFILYPNNKFEIEYIWDEELQKEIDSYNKES